MPRARTILAALAAALTIPLVGFTLAAGLAPWWPSAWRLDVLTNFRWVYAAGLVPALGLWLYLQRWRWLAGTAVAFVIHLLAILPLYFGPAATPSGPALRLVHFNVLTSNDEFDAAQTVLASSHADVISLQEVDDEWLTMLASLPMHQVVAQIPRNDNFGLAIAVRRGITVRSAEVLELVPGVPAVALELEHDGQVVQILSVHTLPPVSREYAATRDRQLAAAGDWAHQQRQRGHTPVILGDLNTTPFGAHFQKLQHTAGLHNSQQGYGWQATWPATASLPTWLEIPLDHCLHDPKLVTTARRVGPSLGSDHRPVHVDLAWATPE